MRENENICADAAEPAQTMAPRVMLLTNELHSAPSGGRELLCKLNHDILSEIFDDGLIVTELVRNDSKSPRTLLSKFRGHIDGVSASVVRKAIGDIDRLGVSKVFVDGSNLGEFVKKLKQERPNLQITTFFHNVEARFFWGSFRQSKTPRALAVLVANYLAEKKAVRHSDMIICLNERDSQLLRKVYGREATHISPMALRDKLPSHPVAKKTSLSEEYALFVGGLFYANQFGITWFIKHVLPRIQIKIYVVGKGFEKIKAELERDGKGRVEVIGAVDSLAEWYADSKFVIAPIFDGSGMKTKVAEALMHGKKVVGTAEAFAGYESLGKSVGWSCASVDEFEVSIKAATRETTNAFDPDLRALYEAHYSYSAAHSRLEAIMKA